LWLGWRGWHEELSANPIEFITHNTGVWTLILTLAVTPLRKQEYDHAAGFIRLPDSPVAVGSGRLLGVREAEDVPRGKRRGTRGTITG